MTDIDQTQDLIHDLLASFTAKPEEIAIEVKEHPGRVYWVVKACGEDTPRIVGRSGAHLKALQFLVREIGKSLDSTHSLELLDPEPGMRPDEPKEPTATSHDPSREVVLLQNLVEALGVSESKVEAFLRPERLDGRLYFDLNVWVRDDQDYKLLTVPPSVKSKATVVEALGVLFRAGAKRNGIRINIVVKRA